MRLTMGGEPTFVVDRRHGRRRSGTPLRSGPTKRRLAGELLRRLRRPLRPGAAAALRPGQVVSRRAAAALGARLPTGARTASRSGATPRLLGARERRPGTAPRPNAQPVRRSLGRAAAGRSRLRCSTAYEDTCYYLWRERRLPAQRRSVDDSEAAATRWSARGWPASSSRAWRRRSARVLPLRARRDNGARPLAERAVVPARRRHVPDPRRFADRLSPAARFACRGPHRPIRTRARARSDGPASGAAAARLRRRRAAAAPAAPGIAESTPRRSTAIATREAWKRALAQDLAAKPGDRTSAPTIVRTALCVEPRDGHAPRLHAAARAHARTISTWSPRSRTPPRRLGQPGRARRLSAAATIRGCNISPSRPIPA